MNEINLDEGTIFVEERWLSAEDIKRQIQEKMDAGDLKFAGLATALEELYRALEDARLLEVSIVIDQEQYKKLRAMVDGDERTCVKAAIGAWIGQRKDSGKKTTIRCANCRARIELPPGERPSEIRCPECNALGRLKSRS